MKLYYSPGACSLAGHIALQEAGAPFEIERVDLRAKQTAAGADYNAIAPKGYVPALVLDDGELITENVALLDYIATQAPQLGLDGARGRTRLLEALAYVSTELHKSYKPFFAGGSDADKEKAGQYIDKRLQYLVDRMGGNYLFGDKPSVADFYLFVTLRWAEKLGVKVPAAMAALRDRIEARPAVQAALASEGRA